MRTDSKVAYSDVKGETCLQGVCFKERGGHTYMHGLEAWNIVEIEYCRILGWLV